MKRFWKQFKFSTVTSEELKAKIVEHKSFWVETDTERKVAKTIASNLGLNYHTSRDGRGGFYIHFLPPVQRRRKILSVA